MFDIENYKKELSMMSDVVFMIEIGNVFDSLKKACKSNKKTTSNAIRISSGAVKWEK